MAMYRDNGDGTRTRIYPEPEAAARPPEEGGVTEAPGEEPEDGPRDAPGPETGRNDEPEEE